MGGVDHGPYRKSKIVKRPFNLLLVQFAATKNHSHFLLEETLVEVYSTGFQVALEFPVVG